MTVFIEKVGIDPLSLRLGKDTQVANKADKMIELLEPMADAHGLDLVDVEVAGTRKNPILRVFLDLPESGITLDDLAEAQEWVDAAVEQADPFPDGYTLEVSSPGIDRPLRRPADFARFAGQRCKVQLKPGEAQSNFTGQLKGMDGEDVLVEDDEGACHRLPLARIKKAHTIGQIDFSARDARDGGDADLADATTE